MSAVRASLAFPDGDTTDEERRYPLLALILAMSFRILSATRSSRWGIRLASLVLLLRFRMNSTWLILGAAIVGILLATRP